MSIPKHILFLTPGFPTDEEETSCLTYFQNYLLALQNNHPQLKITVLSFHYPFSRGVYQWHGIPVISMMGKNKKLLHHKITLWFKMIQQVKKINAKHPIHFIHSLWLKECALLGNYISQRLKIRHICTAMGTEVIKGNNRYLKYLRLEKMELIFVSDFQKKQLQQTAPAIKGKIIPWGVLPNKLPINPFHKREIDILGVASLIELKDFSTFIEIVKILLQEKPNLVVRIIGEGIQEQFLVEKIKKLNLQNHIKLLGCLKNQEVQQYMQNSKVLLHTSTFETQGYVFLEALRNGMKIVSRKVGIAEEGAFWKIAEGTDEFIQRTLQSLQPYGCKSIVPYPMKITTEQYNNIYTKTHHNDSANYTQKL